MSFRTAKHFPRNAQYLRSLFGVHIKRIAYNPLESPLDALLDELVVNLVLHVNSSAGAAALAHVEESALVSALYRQVQVAVVHDNVGRLSAELQSDFFQVGLARAFLNQFANLEMMKTVSRFFNFPPARLSSIS